METEFRRGGFKAANKFQLVGRKQALGFEFSAYTSPHSAELCPQNRQAHCADSDYGKKYPKVRIRAHGFPDFLLSSSSQIYPSLDDIKDRRAEDETSLDTMIDSQKDGEIHGWRQQ